MDSFYSQPFLSVDWLSWLTNYWVCLYALPILTTVFYIYVFPWFSHRVFEYSYNKQIDLNNKKKTLQKSELIDAEDKEKIMLLTEQLKLENRELIVKHRIEIEELQGQIDKALKDKLSEREDAADSQQDLLNTIMSLEKKVEELENGHNVLQPITSQVYDPKIESESAESIQGEEALYKPESKNTEAAIQRPDYINFYESLNLVEKSVAENIVNVMLDNEPDIDGLQSQLLSLSPDNEIVNDIQALKKVLGKMKVYDIVDTDVNPMGTNYSLAKNGKLLYRYILENSANKTMAVDSIEDEEQGNNVNFYFEADEPTQKHYKRILEGLYLEDRRKSEFGINSSLFDSVMVQLILHNLVQKPDEIGKYQITEEGREFYTNLNKMRTG
ncbi:hypothetical protein OAG1_09970 [Agarivorans sp. OAG1]|uniref:hypothetical protein n=1 Tax=Agarivorans sp. OAG1 TaxID=3082387 RepID=UPI002B2BAC0B|nr:hypothetical protein OAG1_09970 [Agarivorans sp. OAG1]